MPDINALNSENLDTPIGLLRVARQPGNWLAVEVIDPYDPIMRRPRVVHTLDERGPFAAVWGNRVHERVAVIQMYQRKAAAEDARLERRRATMRKDEGKELTRLIKKDDDTIKLLMGETE